jgi:small subunit ribosomal protein S9
MIPLKAVGKVGQVEKTFPSAFKVVGGITGQTGAICAGTGSRPAGREPELASTAWPPRGLPHAANDRMVERKKYGFKKARRSFQFSKR